MKIFKRTIALLIVFSLALEPVYGCTTAIVSGNFTPDGRPLLWKHRDSGHLDNIIMYFTDGDYDYIGLVNADDPEGTQVWAGTNSAGFSIMNSASYNLKENEDVELQDREGIIMKQALQQCATLEDFEKMLDELPKPLGVEANFGVIDAEGGAAYYECNNFTFTKIDVNDPKTAPHGYVIRTNYSYTGRRDEGYGYIRYLNAEKLFYYASAKHNLTAGFIIREASRSLEHSLTGTSLKDESPARDDEDKFVFFRDYIPRSSSSSTVVVRGVKQGEPPAMTTMWTILGWQLTSVAVPLWVEGGSDLPEVLTAGDEGKAPLCNYALELKQRCIPIKRGSGGNYLNITPLYNQKGTGIMQKLQPLEESIFDITKEKFSVWENSSFSEDDAAELYKKINDLVKEEYGRLFGLK